MNRMLKGCDTTKHCSAVTERWLPNWRQLSERLPGPLALARACFSPLGRVESKSTQDENRDYDATKSGAMKAEFCEVEEE